MADNDFRTGIKTMAQLQSVINDAQDGDTIVMPTGFFDVGMLGPDGLVIQGRSHVKLLPSQSGRTVLTSTTNGGNVVTIRNSRFCCLRDTLIEVPTGGIGVKMDWDGLSNYNTISNFVTNCRIRSGLYGVKIGDGYGQSTSENRVIACEFSNQTHSGVYLDTGNGQNTVIADSYFTDQPYGVYVAQGSIFCHRNTTTAQSISAYHLDNVAQTPCTIDSGYMEGPSSFITSGGPTSRGCTLNVINAQIYTTGAAPHIDAIVWKNTGPLNIIGGEIRSAPGQTTAIKVEAGSWCPVNVYGLSIWDHELDLFVSNSGTGGFNIVNCLRQFVSGATPVPFSRPMLASEDGIRQFHVVSTKNKTTTPALGFDYSLAFNSGLFGYNLRGEYAFNYGATYGTTTPAPQNFPVPNNS